jgi:hypothetical protein
MNPRGATLLQKLRLPGPILATNGQTLALVSHGKLLVGSLGSLRPVLQFRGAACDAAGGCEVPIGNHDVDLG